MGHSGGRFVVGQFVGADAGAATTTENPASTKPATARTKFVVDEAFQPLRATRGDTGEDHLSLISHGEKVRALVAGETAARRVLTFGSTSRFPRLRNRARAACLPCNDISIVGGP